MKAALQPSTVTRVAVGLAGRPSAPPGAVILGYHDVRPDLTDIFDVTPDRLRRQLEILVSSHTVVPLAEIVCRVRDHQPVDGLAAVTFDDGLDGLVRHGSPILEAAGIAATAFVVTDRPGVEPGWWPGPRRTVDTGQLRELAAQGIEIASHTRTHSPLPGLDDDRLQDELEGSRAVLEDLLGRPVQHLAYPGGHADERVRAATVRAGYRAACTFTNGRVHGPTDLYALPRLAMDARHWSLRFRAHLARSSATWSPAPAWAQHGGGAGRAP